MRELILFSPKLRKHILKLCWATAALLFICSGCQSSTVSLEEKREEQSRADAEWLYMGFEDDTALVLTLEDAIQIALEHNLELLVNQMEFEVQEETATRAKFNLLPKFTLDSEDSLRTKPIAAYSESLEAGVPPAPPSIAGQKRITTYNFNFLWSLMDFGVSYFRSRQEQNKATSKAFEYERAAQTLILKVVRAFWTAAGDEVTAKQFFELQQNMNIVKAKIFKHMENNSIPPKLGARMLDQLLSTQDQVEGYIKQYTQNEAEFKSLLGIPPSREIIIVANDPLSVPKLEFDLIALDAIALNNRPELYSLDLQEKVAQDDIYIAIIQFFPDVTPFVTSSYDGNRFNIYNKWSTVGLRSTWNLLGIPGHVQDQTVAEANLERTALQRLSMSFNVITQVRLSTLMYEVELDRYKIMDQLWKTRHKYLQISNTESKLGSLGDFELLINTFGALEAESKARYGWASLQASLEQVNNAIGIPFYFNLYQAYPSKEENTFIETIDCAVDTLQSQELSS